MTPLHAMIKLTHESSLHISPCLLFHRSQLSQHVTASLFSYCGNKITTASFFEIWNRLNLWLASMKSSTILSWTVQWSFIILRQNYMFDAPISVSHTHERIAIVSTHVHFAYHTHSQPHHPTSTFNHSVSITLTHPLTLIQTLSHTHPYIYIYKLTLHTLPYTKI